MAGSAVPGRFPIVRSLVEIASEGQGQRALEKRAVKPEGKFWNSKWT